MADAIGKALLLPRDIRIWQGDSSKRLIKTLKWDSVLVSFQMLVIQRRLVFSLFY